MMASEHSLASPAIGAWIGTLCGLFLAIAVPKPIGYELSIYAGLNTSAIVPLAVAVVLSYIWVVQGRLWAFTFMGAILGVADLFFVSLPYVKGYYLYGQADPSLFVGYVVDILKTGHTYNDDFYPLAHVLVAQVSHTLDIEPHSAFLLLGPVVWGIFVLGTSLAVKQIEHHTSALASGTIRGLACIFWLPAGEATGLGYAYNILPFSMILLASAMVIYLLLAPKRTTPRTVALIILLVSLPFYHPLIAIIFIASLLLVSFFVKPLSSSFRRMSGMIAVCLAGWLVYFAFFVNTVKSLVLLFSHEAVIGDVFKTVAKLDLSTTGLIEVFAKLYGHGLFVLSLAAISYPIVAKYVRANTELRKALLIPYSFLLVSSVSGLALLSVAYLGFTPFRFYSVGVMLSLPAAIWTLLQFIKMVRDVRVARALAATIIILLWVSSIFSMYPSPYTLTPNDQVTHQMILPVQWLYDHHPSYVIAVASFYTYSTRDMYRSIAGLKEYNAGYDYLPPMPDHFAYGNVSRIKAAYNMTGTKNPIYVVYDTSLTQIYEELYPQVGRYTREDVRLFLSNSLVGKTYDNGDSQVYMVLMWSAET